MKIVYADNNATTPIASEVVEAMTPYLSAGFCNPSSMYDPATTVADAIKKARKQIARILGGIQSTQLFFTSCATESNNWAIKGVASANPKRRHIITTAVEHPAVLEVCKDLERQGYDVTFLPVDRDGNLSIADFIRALRKDTLLVTIMHANNETGVIFPIKKLSRITKETDPAIIFHTDATQTVGKLPIDLKHEFKHIDMLSFSGHKLHTPKGIGALYIKRGTACRPLLIGGHQENGLRAGTENVPYIAALAKACELAAASFDEEERVRKLRDRLQRAIEQIPYIEINGVKAPRLPNTLNLACHYIEGESILYELNEFGICASSGSACSSGSLEPSHVMRAMGVPFTMAHGSIRFSLSTYNTEADIERIIKELPPIVKRLRELSPFS
jgi:cysteine desulfurase